MELKPRIKQILAEKGITQEELAKKMGISQQMISKYIRNEKKPSLERAFQMAMILNCKVDDLYEVYSHNI